MPAMAELPPTPPHSPKFRSIADEGPVMIDLSPDEVVSGMPCQESMFKAVTSFHEDGLIVLRNAVPDEVIDKLNERMSKEAFELLKLPTTHFNMGVRGNFSQVTPLSEEYLFPEIYANAVCGNVLAAILGPSPNCGYIHGNTAVRGTEGQLVHADIGFDHLRIPFAVAANILLVDTDETNGVTELWLGTARDTTLGDHHEGMFGKPGAERRRLSIRDDLLASRRKVRPPIQPFIPKGSIILRDLRMWHAGRPNKTDEPRIMLSLVHTPSWFGNQLKMKLPESARSTVEGWSERTPVRYNVEYLPDEGFNHLTLKFNGNFSAIGGRPGAPVFD